MGTDSGQSDQVQSGQRAADRAEIEEAICQSLTETGSARFLAFAKRLWRISNVRTAAFDADDLMYEALTRIWEGERIWYPQRETFEHFFYGCIRSVVSHRKEKELKAKVVRFPLRTANDCGTWESDIPSDHPSPEAEKMSDQKYAYVMEELKKRLEGSSKAHLVLVHRSMGYSAEQIMEMLELDKNEYDAIRKLVDRHVAAVEKELKGPKSEMYDILLKRPEDVKLTFDQLLSLASYCKPDPAWHKRFLQLFDKVKSAAATKNEKD